MSSQPIYMNQGPEFVYEQNFHGLSDKSIRQNFIRKVLGIVLIQLSFTAIFVSLVHIYPQIQQFYLKNLFLFYIAVGLSFVSMIVIYCTNQGKKHPNNLIWLSLFTICEIYSVGLIGAVDFDILVPAAVITIVMVLALFAYAMTSSTDFTLLGGALFVLVSILLVGTIIGFFFYDKTYELILACFGAFLFSLYLIFDI